MGTCWEGLRAFDCVLRLLLSVEAAFCAAEKTEEKKPLCWTLAGDFEAAFVSSTVGPRADTEFESLLGLWLTEEADRTRRWEIMFPDGLTTTPAGSSSFPFSESGDVVTSGDEKILTASVRGVGGVTVVWGAGIALWGGVLGT
jgi:hypothetical protein